MYVQVLVLFRNGVELDRPLKLYGQLFREEKRGTATLRPVQYVKHALSPLAPIAQLYRAELGDISEDGFGITGIERVVEGEQSRWLAQHWRVSQVKAGEIPPEFNRQPNHWGMPPSFDDLPKDWNVPKTT